MCCHKGGGTGEKGGESKSDRPAPASEQKEKERDGPGSDREGATPSKEQVYIVNGVETNIAAGAGIRGIRWLRKNDNYTV